MSTVDPWHNCHFCGEDLDKEGHESSGSLHLLSECRPDLVEHEVGSACTWWGTGKSPICYAYQDRFGNWTEDHTHFYPDGAM